MEHRMLNIYKIIIEHVVIKRRLYRNPTKKSFLDTLADVRIECCRYTPDVPYPSAELIVRDICRAAKKLAPALLAAEALRREEYRKCIKALANEPPKKGCPGASYAQKWRDLQGDWKCTWRSFG